jgi:hypothetical protein
MLMRWPEVSAVEVKLWPAPTAFTVRFDFAARATMSATSDSLAGSLIHLGLID